MPEAAPSEPSPLEKLKAKSVEASRTVNVAAKKPSEEAAITAAMNAWKPSLKFKAAGKEMDVPELLKPLLKDEDSQKYIHSMLSKAHGIEMIQDKLKTTRERAGQVEHAYRQVMEPINTGREAYQRDDMDTVFKVLQINPQKVLQWAYKKVQLSQMPPEQRAVHEQAESAQRRAWEMERQQRSFSQQHLEETGNQLGQMIDLILEQPQVGAIAQAYDSKRGKEGSFRDLVAMMGDQEFSRTGKIIPPMEATKMAMELLGEKYGAKAQQAPPAQAAAANAAPATTEAPNRRVTLPNAGGSKAASPAKAKVKSLDDIRKLANQIGV